MSVNKRFQRMLSQYSPIFRRLKDLGPIDVDALNAVASLSGHEIEIPRGKDFVTRGSVISHAFAIETGWAMRYLLTQDGRRQITSLVLPGDLVGYESALVGRAAHTVCALTNLRAFAFDASDLLEILYAHPSLIRILAWRHDSEITAMDEHSLRLGRVSAEQRLAHFFAELWRRLRRVGFADDRGFDLPMTQTDISDALGLSLVHTNRRLQEFRRDGVLAIDQGRLRIGDAGRLLELASGRGAGVHALGA